MASSSHSNEITGYVIVDMVVFGRMYKKVRLNVLDNLCTDVILGIEFQKQHQKVVFNYGGDKPAVEVCSLSMLNVEPPDLFPNLPADCKPIATKSRRYSKPDKDFIHNEIQELLQTGVIEQSNSPWRAQVVVTKDPNHKKRLAIDYSQTINKYTQLDAHPLPRIDEFVNKIAQYKVFSSIDLKSAYYQVPLKDSDKLYTAFEADGSLYQFKRMPFCLTNAVSCFQRCMNNFLSENNISDTFAYLDNVYVCGHEQDEHDQNLKVFLDASKSNNWTFNDSKCVFSTRKLQALGSVVSDGCIYPDPERLQPLKDLPVPCSHKSLKRIIGLFSYYSKWIPKFSDHIAPLVRSKSFPLGKDAENAFLTLKSIIENAVVTSIDESLPFEVECDASDIAISSVLNQGSRPVAFFSRMLHGSELKWPSVEKEACSIIESVRHWRHFLTGRRFSLSTDQKSVSFMFSAHHKGKIKNDKIYRWRLEMSCYNFDIIYRPGKDNVAADTFTRVYCSMISRDSLYQLHNALCHPGITRLNAFVKARNLPFSIEDIRKTVSNCQICQECKPRFYKTPKVPLIKATQPMERLNLDFKGPLPSASQNKYLLNIIDEYTRFPFAIPCKDLSAETISNSLSQVFSMFGTTSYVHSDRGSSFMSKELRNYLHSKGIATSRSTPYHPQGNGLVERYNSTIWKAVSLALKSRNLPITMWEAVLPDALHSIRSLISTATGCTPHERMFNFQRRTSSGMSLPTWLSSPGPVLLRRFNRTSKYDPLVQEVQLLEANPNYAFIRYPDGRESTVSLQDLAPRGNGVEVVSEEEVTGSSEERTADVPSLVDDSMFPSPGRNQLQQLETVGVDNPDIDTHKGQAPQLRRSTRIQNSPKVFPSPAGNQPEQPEMVSVDNSDIDTHKGQVPQLRKSTRIRKPPEVFVP